MPDEADEADKANKANERGTLLQKLLKLSATLADCELSFEFQNLKFRIGQKK